MGTFPHWRENGESTAPLKRDGGRKRAILIAAAIFAARKLAPFEAAVSQFPFGS